jgi:sialate O-acetylesterase
MLSRPGNIDVWVLAGQSNMQGVGELAGALPPDERVWNFTSAGKWEIAEEPLHRLWESCTPIHQTLMRGGQTEEQHAISDADMAAEDAKRHWGATLGIAFGKTMANELGRPIGLISAAHGGTSLDQWSPDLKDKGGDSLYGAMLQRIEMAGGNLRGILWYQGESDAWDTPTAITYTDRFVNWVERLRADLNKPDLPVLTVQIGNVVLSSVKESSWNIVRHQQYDVPDRIARVTVTPTVDLTLEDCIHISTPDLIRLGHRMARQALALTENAPLSTGPRIAKIVSLPKNPKFLDRAESRITFTGVTGGWNPTDHIAGFSIYDANGDTIPDNYVYRIYRDREDPTAIILRTNLPLRSGDLVGYGQGINPYCNAADDADMGLCAFLMPVE